MKPLTEDSSPSGSMVPRSINLVQAIVLVSLLAGCVTQPAPNPEEIVSPDLASVVDAGELARELPLFHQLPPIGSSLVLELPEPGIQEPPGSLSPGASTAKGHEGAGFQPGSVAAVPTPMDITVLSRLPEAPALIIPMPDPVLPLPVATPVMPPVPAAPTAPAAPTPRVPEARPALVPSASPVLPPAVSSVPVPAKGLRPEQSAVPESPAASGNLPVLPVPPSSSARSLEAAPAAIPETRVEVARGQRFDLRLRGSGWTYLGDEDGRDGVRYETRRFEDNHAVFVMNPAQSGEYLLRFQRQDPLELKTEASLVRLLVNPSPPPGIQGGGPSPMASFVVASAGSPAPVPGSTPATMTATAPSVAQATAPTAAANQSTAPEAAQPARPGPVAGPGPAAGPGPVAGPGSVAGPGPVASQGPAAGQGPAARPAESQSGSQAASQASGLPLVSTLSDPAALIKLARDELSASRVNSALEALDRYRSLFPNVMDEIFYLYALAYEQDTPFRDIKKSHENYRRVRDEFPRSQFWRQSAERLAYLERHFPGLR